MISNALTNAAQACEGVITPIIEIEFLYREWLIITMSNPYVIPPVFKNDKYISQKGNGHGLGIQNMLEIVEKYNGQLLIENREGTFKLEVMLQRRI